MEHIEIINRIIEAEHEAQAIANSAREQKEHLSESLSSEKEQIRRELYARADRRIGLVRERERSIASEQIDALEQKLKGDLDSLIKSYEANREHWLDELFSSITGKKS